MTVPRSVVSRSERQILTSDTPLLIAASALVTFGIIPPRHCAVALKALEYRWGDGGYQSIGSVNIGHHAILFKAEGQCDRRYRRKSYRHCR